MYILSCCNGTEATAVVVWGEEPVRVSTTWLLHILQFRRLKEAFKSLINKWYKYPPGQVSYCNVNTSAKDVSVVVC